MNILLQEVIRVIKRLTAATLGEHHYYICRRSHSDLHYFSVTLHDFQGGSASLEIPTKLSHITIIIGNHLLRRSHYKLDYLNLVMSFSKYSAEPSHRLAYNTLVPEQYTS